MMRYAVPMFLSTKLMPRGDKEANKDDEAEAMDSSGSHVEAVEAFNDSVDDISTRYQAAGDEVLRQLLSPPGGTR